MDVCINVCMSVCMDGNGVVASPNRFCPVFFYLNNSVSCYFLQAGHADVLFLLSSLWLGGVYIGASAAQREVTKGTWTFTLRAADAGGSRTASSLQAVPRCVDIMRVDSDMRLVSPAVVPYIYTFKHGLI